MNARLGVALAAVLVGATQLSAYADKVVAGGNTGQNGVVVSRYVPTPSDQPDANPAVQMLSTCHFSAVPTGLGTLHVEFGGNVVVTPLSASEIPATTTVRCEVNNLGSGGTDVAIADSTQPGPLATATSIAVFPFLPITICVTSDTTSPGGTTSNPRACRPPDVPNCGSGLASDSPLSTGASVQHADDAAPPPGGPVGGKCDFKSTADCTREAGWQTGVIYAGPLVTGEAGTLSCSIHVNNDVHVGFAVVIESVSATADGVAVMEPRALNYPATAADDVFVCTSWDGASGTLYWVSGNPAVPTDTGHWDTSASASCGVALSIG